MFFPHVHADSEPSFNYSTTWRIIYFQGDTQFVNQRPDTEYNPLQGFIFIYEILNKYVYQMQKFNKDNINSEMNDLGIWTQIYLVNDVTYQELFIGDHTLSDGKSWVILNDKDYLKLSQMLLRRQKENGNPFDGDKEKALNNLLWTEKADPYLDDFDTHFHISKDNAVRNENEPGSRQISSSGKEKNLDKIILRTNSSESNIETKLSSEAHMSAHNNSSSQLITDQKVAKDSTHYNDEIKTTTQSKNNFGYMIWLSVTAGFFIILYYLKRKK